MIIPNVFTVDQVASILGVSKRTVNNLASSGKLKKIKQLGKTRITEEALNEFLSK